MSAGEGVLQKIATISSGMITGAQSAGDDDLPYVVGGVVEEYVDDEVDSGDEAGGDGRRKPAGLDRNESHKSFYNPISVADAEKIPSSDQGLIWHAQLVAGDYKHPRHVTAKGELKPRRPLPHARAAAFLKALVKTSDGRWMFGGVLNGWPALTNLELRSITFKPKSSVGMSSIKRYFNAETGKGDVPATAEQIDDFERMVVAKGSVRVTLRAPAWSSIGYSPKSHGFVLFYDLSQETPRVLHGTDIVNALGAQGASTTMQHVHHFGHRYAKLRESAIDRITYHSALVIEWHPTRNLSVVELAWRNGLGGYGGKSNFVEDRDSGRPMLYDRMPAEMKAPWREELSEIRVIDVPAGTKDEFHAYLKKYEGASKRFLEPQITRTADVNLSNKTAADLFTYLVNYSLTNTPYAPDSRNCQTFSADLFRFLTGEAMEPYHPLVRPRYQVRAYDFLYEPKVLRRIA